MRTKNWLILFIGLSTSSMLAQDIELSAGTMISALSQIESSSDWLINYNPDVVDSLLLSHTVEFDLNDIERSMSQLFSGHPISFTIKDNVILVIPKSEKLYHICGHLRDKESGEALEFVNTYTNIHQGTWTDLDGYFELGQSIAERDDIHFSYVGYEELVLPASSFASGCLDLQMSIEVEDFPTEIIVRDYFLPSITQGKDYTGIQMNMSTMHREIGAIERDVLKTIQFIPGITSLDESAGNLTIRGSLPSQNLILWEDAPVYNSGHLFGMISSINPFVVDDLKVYKDVHSPAYDNRIGGILDVRLDDEAATAWHGAIGTTMTEVHTEVSVPIIKDVLSLQLAGRKSIGEYVDQNPTLQSYSQKLFQSSALDDNSIDQLMDNSETELKYSDINAKLIYRPGDQFYWSSSFLRTENTFEYEYDFGDNNPEGMDFLYTYSLIWSNLFSYNWKDQSQSTLRVNLSNYNSIYNFTLEKADQVSSDLLKSNDNDITDIQVKLAHRFNWNGVQLEGGYILDRKRLSYNISQTARFEEDYNIGEDQSGYFHHLFLNNSWHRGKWLIDAGARATFLDSGRSAIVSPRFTVSRSINEHLNLKLSGGLFNQYIRQVEQFNQSTLNFKNEPWVLATNELMIARKWSLGFNYQKNAWLVDFDIYSQTASGVPVLSRGQSAELEISALGNTTSTGLELLLKRRWNQWNSALSYHLSKVNFDLPEPVEEEFSSNNDQRHTLSWVNYYKLNSWSIGAQYQYHSGLPFTEINNLKFIEANDEEYYEVEVSGLNNQRLGDYHRIDLYLGYQKSFADKVQFNAQFSLLNIFNFQQATNRSFILQQATTGDDPEVFEVEKLQLGLTPQLLFRLSF